MTGPQAEPVFKTVLDNGIRVLTAPMPHLRSITMGVWVEVGARDESDAEAGLSHFLEHMIFKGTRKRSAYQIAKAFDAIGGVTNAFTSMENTCYHAKVMSNHLDTMVDILSDIFLNSVFDEKEIERERPVVFQELGMLEDSPEDYVHLLSGKTYWGDHPLGRSIIGTPENLHLVNTERLSTFFHKLYQPTRIVIAAAGDVAHDQLLGLITPAFESVKPGNGFPHRMRPKAHARIHFERKKMEQVHLCFCGPGIPIVDPRRYALSLLNTILGGNMSSRLFQQIREKRGLAYSIFSFANAFVDTGMFCTYAAVAPESLTTATGLILEALQQVAKTPVTTEELAAAKDYTRGNLLLSAESNDSQMVRLAQNELNFGRHVSMAETLAAIEAVTPDDVHALAAELFDQRQLALTALGPVQVKPQTYEKMLKH